MKQKALNFHAQWQGKLAIHSKVPLKTMEDLSYAYTPGVAEPCKEILADPTKAYTYTMKQNTIAVVSDGSAVLGLGNIGPLAAMPVMEGKSVLFKEFADINAVPICLDTQDPEEIIKTVKYLAPNYSGINLEDIEAPKCFYIEERLIEELDIPVFHDDQHGTAIVVLAGLYNSLKLVNKETRKLKIVINGCGSAGTAIAKLLLSAGFRNIVVVDKKGIIQKDEPWLNWSMKEIALITNPHNLYGSLQKAIKRADVFIGVSGPNLVTKEMIASMNDNAIVFAMANPIPEIMPEDALVAGARVVGSGRSDYPNQVNNVLAFPGIFKGAMLSKTSRISLKMKLAAAKALADFVTPEQLSETHILPFPFEKGVADCIAQAIITCAKTKDQKESP